MGASHEMPLIQLPFRRATMDDIGPLAQLVEFASEGLALYLWAKLAGGRHDPWCVGRERVGSETGALSYRNAVIAELAGRPAAGLIGYSLPDQPESISVKLPAILVPLHELMNLALGTRYIHVLWGLSYGSLSHVLYEQQAFSRKESDIGHRKIQQWGPWQKEQIIE
jgi:hypothetical protein